MKELILYAAVLVAAVIVIAAGDDTPITPIPKECPKKDSVNFTVHIAHETNCTLFYMCERGHKILRICPLRDQEGNRLYFNPLLQVCDWPESAGCTSEDGTTPEPPTTKPTEPTTTTAIPTTSAEIPTTTTEIPTITTDIPVTTTEILTTTTEIPVTTTKIPTTSAETPITTTKISTTSTEIPITTTEISMTTENSPNIPDLSQKDFDYIRVRNAGLSPSPPVSECPPDLLLGTLKIKIPHESNCNLYYTCENGTKVLNECEEGLYYDPLLQMCDWETESSCPEKLPTPTPKPSLPTNPTPVTLIPPECPKKDSVNFTVHIAHETNCSLFYMCERGRKILRICPFRDQEGNRLYFNPVLQVCDWPENAGCTSEDGSTTELPTAKPTEPAITTEIPAITTEIPVTTAEVPTAFTELPIRITEIPNTTENPPNIPDLSEENSGYIIVRNSGSSPRPPVTECPEIDTEDPVLLPHEYACDKYYQCRKGEQFLKKCPKGQGFSVKLYKCLSLKYSDCLGKDSEIPEDEIGEVDSTPKWQNPDTCMGICPAVDPVEYTVLLENFECNRFCSCSNGIPIVQTCPPGLEFSPKSQACESPATAGCRWWHENKDDEKLSDDKSSFYARLFHWGS